MFSTLAEMSILEQYFDVEPNWDFNANSKVLEFFDTTGQTASKLIIEAYVMYEPQAVDMIFNHQWIKDYSTATTKKYWGSNIGKLNTTLINGATLNYERILQEANAEIEKLEGELITKWSKPLGIIRG
jgi:hypothetical protein